MQKARNKTHKTTAVDRPNGGTRVYYWVLDHQTGKFLRKSKDFSAAKLEDAEEFANDREAEMGVPAEITVSMDDRIFLNRVRKMGSLDDILQYLNSHYRPAVASITLAEAKKRFTEFKRQMKRRSFTMRDYDTFFARTEKWDSKALTDIGDKTAQDILNQTYNLRRKADPKMRSGKEACEYKTVTQQYSAYNKQKFAKAMSALWTWAIDNRHAQTNPWKRHAKSQLKRQSRLIRYYTPEQVKKLLDALPRDLQPVFALMAFAGIRPFEICPEEKPKSEDDEPKRVLKWSDIDFNRRQISIDGDVAKIGCRLIRTTPDNLWAWLSRVPAKRRKGNVIGACTYTMMTDA